MVALRLVIQEAMASQDMSKITAVQGEVMGLMSAGSGCFETLEKRFPDIAKNDSLRDRVSAQMEKQCPRPDMGFPMGSSKGRK